MGCDLLRKQHMKNKEITRADILSIDEYAVVRGERKRFVSAIKKDRRVAVGPDASFYFESFETMLHQVQEMLFIERGGEAQVDDELNAYNTLIPNGHELVATLMFEIDNAKRRAEFLSGLGGVENKVKLFLNDDVINGVPEAEIERTNDSGKASALHFLHFPFQEKQVRQFKNLETAITLGVEHKKYSHLAIIPKETQKSLSEDLD